MHVDLLVIGWGKAGKTLAGRAAAQGRSVALVERSPQMYGGTCINIGCVPTKDLVVSAERRRPDDDPDEYFRSAVSGRNELTARLNTANHTMLEKPGITLIDGTARFVGERTVAVDTADGELRVSAEAVVVGTGAVPRRLDVPGGDGPRIYDSTTIQGIDPLPRRLVIVGGGFIGQEFAGMFAQFGAEVTVIDSGEQFLPQLDPDVADATKTALQDLGVRIVQSAHVTAVDDDGDHAVVRTSAGDYPADAVLVAIGRVPVTENLGLEAAGVELNERGFIVVDDQLQTTAAGVYAVGDVNGGPQFTYISLDDNRIVWDALYGQGTRRRSDRVAVPHTAFLTPPLSFVGLSSAQARDSGRNVLVAVKPVAQIAAMPRPKIVGQTHGLIRVLVDADSREILGATVFCIDSQEIINLIALAMRAGVTVDELRDGIWTHPSSTEALNEVLGALEPLG